MLFAEMVCYYKNEGKSIYQRLQELYKQHGYYVELSEATTFPGLDGMKIMADKMDKLGKAEIKTICGIDVEFKDDLNTSTRTFADGRKEKIDLPKSNVYYYSLTSGDWVCARPSGTEPKLKVYVSACGRSKEEALEKATALIKDIKARVIE
jgi:phosphoglucomutase